MHGPGADEPLVWYEGSGTEDKRFLVSDERGSVVLVTSKTGGVVRRNTYDETGVAGSANLGRFGYTGQARITGTDLWQYKARRLAASPLDGAPGRIRTPDP